MNSTRVSDLTVDELMALLEAIVREAVRQAFTDTPALSATGHRPPLNLPVMDVGPWPKGLDLSREALYGDDER